MYLAVWLSSEGSNANHPQKSPLWSTVIRPLGDSEADIKQYSNVAEMSSRTHSTHWENWEILILSFFIWVGESERWFLMYAKFWGRGCLVVTVVNILSSKSQFMRNGRIPCLKNAVFPWLWLNSITFKHLKWLELLSRYSLFHLMSS